MASDQIFIINVLNFDCVKMNKKKYLNSAPNLVHDEVVLNHRQKHKTLIERRKQTHLL